MWYRRRWRSRPALWQELEASSQALDRKVGARLAATLPVQKTVHGGLRGFDLRSNARLSPAGLLADLQQQFLGGCIHTSKNIRG